jgi:hypothetical protein
VADALRGSVAWVGELLHLPEIASAWLLWLLARRRPHVPVPGKTGLAVVPDQAGPSEHLAR